MNFSENNIDQIEQTVRFYEPYDPAEPPSLTSSLLNDENPDILTDQQIQKRLLENPDVMTDEEMFETQDYEYRFLNVKVPQKPVEMTKATIDKTTDLAVKGVWKGLGALAWPFERIEYGIGTPATAVIKTIGPVMKDTVKFTQQVHLNTPGGRSTYKDMIRSRLSDYSKKQLGSQLEPTLDSLADQVEQGILTHDELMSDLSDVKREAKTIIPAVLTGAKSFVPFTRNDPEKVKNFNDFWGAYYEAMTEEPAPEWIKQVAGAGTSFLVTPLLFGKMVKGLRTGFEKIPMVQKILQNRLPSWQEAKLLRKANIYERSEKAAAAGKLLADKEATRIAHELSLKTEKTISKEAVKLRLGQIVKGSITQQASLAEAANPAVQELQANFKELQKLGILGSETYLTKLSKTRVTELTGQKLKLLKSLERLKKTDFPGQAQKIKKLQMDIDRIDEILWNSTHFGSSGQAYMPRMYLTNEAEIKATRGLMASKLQKIKAPYAKARKEIPFEVRRQMGEIMEPAFPVTKRLIQEAQDIETAKLFELAAKNTAWVDDVWREGLSINALPATKNYGALAGKYVHPKIYADVTELTRVRGNIESLYDSIIGTWKISKVTLNPSTHFRNTISNSILLDLSGTDHVEQGRLFVKAINEIRQKTDDYKFARKIFGHTTMVSGELLDDLLRQVQADKAIGLQKTLNTWNTMYSKGVSVPSKIYQNEEFIFKFMKFLEQREKGMSALGAAKEANKWLFDYSDLSNFEKNVMRRVMPFYTFPRKALPRIIEAAEKNPMSLAKYPVLAWAEEKYALHRLEMTDSDYREIQKILPDYMKNGSYMLMPFRDANGKLLFFDWTYILPWGELYDVQDRGLLGEVVTNPMVQVTADIVRNKSGFSGREIWDETDTLEEQTFKKMIYFWQAAVPSLMYKGIYWDRLYNAATGKPSKMGDIPPLAPAVAHTIFGMRTQAIDVEQQRLYYLYDKMEQLEALESKIRDITVREANDNITEEEYNKKREQYIQQIQSLFSEEQ